MEKLTLRKLAQAFHLAADLGLAINTKEGESFKTSTPIKNRQMPKRLGNKSLFYFDFDDVFRLKLVTGKTALAIETVVVELSDKNHILVPYSFTKGLKESDADEEIIWKHDGPWATILEKKVKEIYQAVDHYYYKKEQEVKKSERFFQNHLKEKIIPSAGKTVNIASIIPILADAASFALVGVRKLDESKKVYRFEEFLITKQYRGYRSPLLKVKITLIHGNYEYTLFDGEANTKGEIEFSQDLWGQALMYAAKKLEDEVKTAKNRQW